MKPISPTYFPSTPSSGFRCCNTGHPVLADPLTGRTVCSCQLQTGVPAYLSRVPSLPETVYNHGTGKISKHGIMGEHSGSAFYPTYPGDKLVSNLKTAPPAVHPYYLDHIIAAHPYGALYPGFDLNGARRKNTNREATGPLKAWIYQHRKNPYPTKGEKVMLAIISQMTMTQVSTWFANARRRLKKESKTGDKDVDLTDIDIDDTNIRNDSSSSRLTDSDSKSAANLSSISKSSSELSDISDCEDQPTRDQKPAKTCVQRLFSPDGRAELFLERISTPGNIIPCSFNQTDASVLNSELTSENDIQNTELIGDVQNKPDVDVNITTERNVPVGRDENKPRIWSIAQIIG